MKKFLIIIIVFLLYSCDTKKYTYIPNNEKPILQNNDTAFFIGSENKVDTFIIKRRDYYDVSDKLYYQECIDILYQKLNKTSTFKDFSIQQGLSSSLSIDGNYFSPTWEIKNTIDFTLHGVVYHSVYFMQDEMFPDTIPCSIYYTCKYGIIRYDFPDGRYYELKNR